MKTKIVLIFVLMIVVSISLTTAQANENLTTEKKETVVNYADVRIKQFPISIQCWTFRKFTFFEALKKIKALDVKYVQAYPGQQLSKDIPDVKFDHKLPDDKIKLVKKKLHELGLEIVSYGVVGFENVEENMKPVFEFAKKLGIKTIVTEPKYNDYSLIEKMVKKSNIQIAIHNHPKPSKYALPETVKRRIKNLDKRIGVCADTGHWLRSEECPIAALKLLNGRILDVHLKDLDQFGVREAQDVPFGLGKANIHDILAELTLQNFSGYLAVEHENKNEIDNPSPSIKKGIEYIKSITYFNEDYEQILKSHNGRFNKHGWNHYGPGYFILCEESGVLKSQGGMGLFWFSEKKYKDFVLELDFKCSKENTNSGVFLRVPNMLTNNDYIHHSFEIQIDNATKSEKHKTGAAYDSEAPTEDAWNPIDQWNHFKITFKGDNIKVELNNKQVLDWDAEPRGKIRDFAKEGYIGLQNHDSRSPVYFRNIYVKEL
ncbi:DUF1080 domain-containing protein [candidate division KSB1 bacterium]|nr:DUF1080 domain-containing protein [candidate division KSB1 bacterium]